MFLDSNRWERRFDRVVKAVAWVTLAYGVSLSIAADLEVQDAIDPETYLALAVAGIWVVGLTLIPRTFMFSRRRLVIESISFIGVALSMTAVGSTGGPSSPYLLMTLSPILVGAFFGTFRIGLGTAAFASALLLVQTVPVEFRTERFNDMTVSIGLFFLVGITFAQARRILVAEALRATATAKAFEEAQLRLSRLEHANELLTRLSTLADSRELNPIEVGDAALDGLTRLLPINSGMTALASEQGPVIVARRGTEHAEDAKASIPLRVGDREVGLVVVTTDDPLSADQLEQAEESLRPVALAFANVQLLQDIARRAIREERSRLARELHDEIGPSLASLGLAVDLAILQSPSEPSMSGHLQHLRNSVGGLVEEIRATVADLREETQPSLIEAIKNTADAMQTDDLTIEVKLDERRPPRPSVAADVAAIITEALRNAIRHAEAETVTIHGTSDFDTGEVTVHDNGQGFIRDRVPTGHFGLIGMQERADKIGAALNVTTGKQGTAVTIAWGPK